MSEDQYYIEAARLRSTSNNDESCADWRYKLNTGIRIPSGSTVQITNSFINKQGIQGNSLEFSEDISETFQVGFTVPQSAMFLQKPERTAKDDRLTTASLDDPEGSLGLQTGEISTVLTNYFDGLVQHNALYSGGIDLFKGFTKIVSVASSGGAGITVTLEGDVTADIKPGLPCQIRNLLSQDAAGVQQSDERNNKVAGYYMRVVTVTLNAGNTDVITDSGKTLFDEGHDYNTIQSNPPLPDARMYYPDINDTTQYSSMFGLAFINSLTGTKEGGGTIYDQTRIDATPSAWEDPPPVPPLENQIDGLNYQGGIDSQIPAEEFRSQTANPTRDNIFNASQTEVDSYDFDRGEYSFLFGPATQNFNATTGELDFEPMNQTLRYSWECPGLNGHTIRQNAVGLNIGTTSALPKNEYYTDTSGNKVPFYPFGDAIPMTEYPGRLDLSIPRPAQPAKFRDSFCAQVDYLQNGFSWDCSPSRVELFTANEIVMNNYGGEQNPFQPNIYQAREGQAITTTNLSTLEQSTFLDRVILSQTMIAGMYNRSDSYPYIKRTITITSQAWPTDAGNHVKVGTIIWGEILSSSQTADVRKNLFPYRQFRGELDDATTSSLNEYSSTRIRIPFVIRALSGEGTTAITVTDIQPITNLQINGAVCENFFYAKNNQTVYYNGTVVGDQISLADVEAYSNITFTFTCEITSESSGNNSPQYIPIFSAKGTFSDLKGFSEYERMASDNDIDIGGGETCRFNYFMDTMHNQTKLDYAKMVGEDYFINPNVSQNFDDFIGDNIYRVTSFPAFNMGATSAGLRESNSQNKRIFIQQKGTALNCGIHPRRTFTNITTGEGLDSLTANMNHIQTANYMFGSTSKCSMGAMRPPGDKEFKDGQVVMNVPLVGTDPAVPTPANNGLEKLSDTLQNFDPDDTTNVLKLKKVEQRAGDTEIEGIRPLQAVSGVFPAVAQTNPLGRKGTTTNPNCASALGDYEAYPYSTPSYDMMDTGGSGDDLCLVQLQSLVDDRSANYGDYVMRPLTSDVNIFIPRGVYSIQGFLDLFNAQIKDIDINDNEDLATIDNFKTVRRFTPLGGNALTGGQVTLLNDFTADTHKRTVFSTDPDSEFITNPLVVAISVQHYNDLCRAWQLCGGDPFLVSYYFCPLGTSQNAYFNSSINKTIGGGTYVWKNFRETHYWAEFVDKYSDNVQNLFSDDQADDIENYDVQFYFAKFRNGDDAVGTANNYGAQAYLGKGDTGVEPVADPSVKSQFLIEGDTVPQIDKIRKYNSVKRGIYVGSPDFELTYNSDEGLFALDGLHYSFRNPTVDLTGESAYDDSTVGQPTVLYRSLSELIQGEYSVNGVSAELDPAIKNALETPLDQVSGCFIYNAAATTALSKGDFINSNSSNIGRIFNDYFTTDSKAGEAWKSTFWYRLGFDYETFNTIQNNNLASYYLTPTSDQLNLETSYLAIQTPYLISQTSDYVGTVKNRIRQVLIVDKDDATVSFNYVSSTLDENYLPGIKTNSRFDIRSIPTLASLPGINEGAQNELVRLYNNASLNTIRSMSGGYVYFPMKLGSPDSFDPIVNYTVQNISTPNEGFVFSSPRQGNTFITSKSGAAVPPASQLLYERSWSYLGTAVPGYNPTSFYSKEKEQPVSAPIYPVQYKFENTQYKNLAPFEFSHESQFNISNGVFRDRTFNLNGSMFLASQSTPISSESNDILGDRLPILTTQGHYIITSDIISSLDSINGDDQLPILGIVPVSSLSSQDFIVAINDIERTINQDIVINSVRIRILNPDLTEPFLQPDSSVVLKITSPTAIVPIPSTKSEAEKIQQSEIEGEPVV